MPARTKIEQYNDRVTALEKRIENAQANLDHAIGYLNRLMRVAEMQNAKIEELAKLLAEKEDKKRILI